MPSTFGRAESGALSCMGLTAATIRTELPSTKSFRPNVSFTATPPVTTSTPFTFSQIVTFEDLGSGQTRLIWHGKFPSAEERTRVIREYGADKGLAQTMARLADYVATMPAARGA